MKIINKQKFLAELGRLLTFMFEEDRQEALALYNEMFNDAADEQSLLQFLVSPTRQAVVIARAYQSGSGKLQVHATSRSENDINDNEGIPSYILAIENLRHDAELKGIVAVSVDKNQFSMFEDAAPEELDSAFEERITAQDEYSAPEVTEAAVFEAVEEESELPMHEQLINEFIFDMPVSEEPAAEEAIPEFEVEETAPAAEAEETAPEAEAEEEQLPVEDADVPAEATEDVAVDNTAEAAEEKAEETAEKAMEDAKDAVDAFLADFSIPEEHSELPAAPAPARKTTAIDPIADDFTGAEKITVRKARPLLLVLFLIFAIPIGLAGIGVLLLPTTLFFSLAVTALTMGLMLITTAFGGFAMLSDILVVFGGSLVLLALGLLFAWLFIWFIGGAIVGLIRGLCRLARKWCYKEVDA